MRPSVFVLFGNSEIILNRIDDGEAGKATRQKMYKETNERTRNFLEHLPIEVSILIKNQDEIGVIWEFLDSYEFVGICQQSQSYYVMHTDKMNVKSVTPPDPNNRDYNHDHVSDLDWELQRTRLDTELAILDKGYIIHTIIIIKDSYCEGSEVNMK